MSLAKTTFVLRERCHLEYFLGWLADHWERQAQAGAPIAITATETKRSLEQNALMWVILTAWSQQIEWQVNGKAQLLDPEDWKDILTAAFMRETGRIAPGLGGGMVLLGCRTRDFGLRQMAEFLTFLDAATKERGVVLKPFERLEPTGRVA